MGRFRLWLVAVEDSTFLGMGFRAYYSHIRESLAVWLKAGVSFLNAKGERLNLDALQPDDLWGFLGKKDETLSGPKRKIHDSKLAVLDVYFKYRHPNLVKSFTSERMPFEVAVKIKSFFSGVNFSNILHYGHIRKIHDIRGIYLKFPNFTLREIRLAIDGDYKPDCTASVIMIHYNDGENSSHLTVHRLKIPVNSADFSENLRNIDENSDLFEFIDKNIVSQTHIYGGIGLVFSDASGGADITIAALLRDITTYYPSVFQFNIRRRIYGFNYKEIYTLGIDTTMYSSTNGDYLYCGYDGYHDINSLRIDYNPEFINKIYNIYKNLGSGS